MRRTIVAVTVVAGLSATTLLIGARTPLPPGCDDGNAGLTLPQGFCAGIFARGIPSPRHIVVASNGDAFVITNRGGGRGAATGPQRGVYRLRDANGDGKADTLERVADGTGSSLWLANNSLYAEGGGSTILRYPFKGSTTDLAGTVDTIVTGLPNRGNHTTRDFVVRGNEMFVNVGSATNVCEPPPPPPEIDPKTGQRVARPPAPPSPSADPCIELETRAGIWKFDATKKGQEFSASLRYATGIRNAVGITINPRDNEVYTTQHGRDQLKLWNNNTDEFNAENPGEEFFHVVQGGEYGWPYCYYSHAQKKKVIAPEYGDTSKPDRCANMQQPVYAFPGHWAPNASLFYTGAQFPAKYREGVFVAFHGSWNRAPLPQAGFNVTFLPMKNGKANGVHEVFADGFYGDRSRPAGEHRPTGIGQMKDGSLLVSDDAANLIYHIVYTGR